MGICRYGTISDTTLLRAQKCRTLVMNCVLRPYEADLFKAKEEQDG